MSFIVNRCATLFPLLLLSGACNQLDALGEREVVTERLAQGPKDDQLSSKHPAYDPNLTIKEQFGSEQSYLCEVTLNKSASVTRLTLQALTGTDLELDGRLFRTRSEALSVLGGRVVVPSMEVVNGALKPFNDGMYAAVQLLAESGTNGVLVNKRALFDGLLTEMLVRAGTSAASRAAAVDFAAASALAGSTGANVPTDIAAAAASAVQQFDTGRLLSKPIGFYTWLPELERIFRRDRYMMYASPTPDSISEVVSALSVNGTLQQAYRNMLHWHAGLTNPFRDFSPIDVLDIATQADTPSDAVALMTQFRALHPDLGTHCTGMFRWLPPSTSPETELFDRMACNGIASSSNLLDALILAIQTGSIDLTPNANSGWYGRQLYALETLLLPDRATERDHLLLTREYKEKLIETFKSFIVQMRETQVNSLRGGATNDDTDSTPIDLYPLLPVEPFPTFYLRTARAYDFVASLLSSILGEGALSSTSRVLEDGTRASKALALELQEKIRRLYGLHLVAAASIGMHHEVTAEESARVNLTVAEAEARAWLQAFASDADVQRDPRVLVPVADDGVFTTYWGVVGVRVLHMHASYPKGYEPQVVTAKCGIRGFVAFEPYLLVEQAVEFRRPHDRPPLTRQEFHNVCNQYGAVEAIRAALEAQ